MSPPEVCFWLLIAGVAYPYLIYPALLVVTARLRGRPLALRGPRPQSFSVVVAAHNEAPVIARRVKELTDLAAVCPLESEIILVCDGCTDATATLARAVAGNGVRVLELPFNVGKAAALSQGCAAASGEIVVFADVRQTWDNKALAHLLESFADPEVGAVSGDLVLQKSAGVLSGVSLYWRYEKCLRRLESRIYSTVGVTGAISAVRRSLFHGIPQGTLVDDLYWPLQVALQGYRVVHEEKARAYDRLPDCPRDEFRRKVRTLCGNFQLLARLPVLMQPRRNPVWFQLVSHKILRLAVPWMLLGLLILSAVLPGAVYRVLFWGQAAGYLLALWGLWRGTGSRMVGAATSFFVLNSAAWLAFWVWVSGSTRNAWQKVSYIRMSEEESATKWLDTTDRGVVPAQVLHLIAHQHAVAPESLLSSWNMLDQPTS